MLIGGKQIVSSVSIRYSIKPVEGDWKKADTSSTGQENHVYVAFEYTRIATGQYEYIGYDLNTATSLKDSLTQKYNRTKKLSKWNAQAGEFIDTSDGNQLMADITMQQIKGHMYKVIVNVREEDRKMRTKATYYASSLFTVENQRNYED